MPKFIALLPVRDEEDIVQQCIDSLLEWADQVYVFDTGSVDTTWEIVLEIASRDRRLVPMCKDQVYFSENLLRGWMFHKARESLRDGDWFLRVDSDEFHHVPPPVFVSERIEKHETIVWHQYYNFILRKSEAFDSSEQVAIDRARPIAERRRWYRISEYSEPRLCQYRSSMKWPGSVSFPYNSGFVAKARIPIRHYPHRDWIQMKRRFLLRAAMYADPNRATGSFAHWEDSDWRSEVVADDSADIHCWEPNNPLNEVFQLNHLSKPLKRTAQRITHRFLLPILDHVRPGWREGHYPNKMSPGTVDHLRAALEFDEFH